MPSSKTVRALPVLPEYANVVVKPRARDYLVDGVKFQRVTTALGIINKPALIPWAKRVALAKVSDVLLAPEVQAELLWTITETPTAYKEFVEKVIDRASKAPDEARDARGDSGTETHKIIQDALALGPAGLAIYKDSVEPEYRRAMASALAFLEDFGITVCDTERVVWLPGGSVAGTVDGIGWRDDKLIIWDWKTGAHIYWETALQLGAYAHCLEHLTGVRVEEAFAVRLPRADDDGGYEARALSQSSLALAWDSYWSAVTLHRASKETWWEEPNE